MLSNSINIQGPHSFTKTLNIFAQKYFHDILCGLSLSMETAMYTRVQKEFRNQTNAPTKNKMASSKSSIFCNVQEQSNISRTSGSKVFDSPFHPSSERHHDG
nr:hypothetical protein [Marseillevirus cajuinensis]